MGKLSKQQKRISSKCGRQNRKYILNKSSVKKLFSHLNIGFWIFRGMLSGSIELVCSSGGEEPIWANESGRTITKNERLKENWFYVETEYQGSAESIAFIRRKFRLPIRTLRLNQRFPKISHALRHGKRMKKN